MGGCGESHFLLLTTSARGAWTRAEAGRAHPVTEPCCHLAPPRAPPLPLLPLWRFQDSCSFGLTSRPTGRQRQSAFPCGFFLAHTYCGRVGRGERQTDPFRHGVSVGTGEIMWQLVANSICWRIASFHTSASSCNTDIIKST
jgi:hypothetical protein